MRIRVVAEEFYPTLRAATAGDDPDFGATIEVEPEQWAAYCAARDAFAALREPFAALWHEAA